MDDNKVIGIELGLLEALLRRIVQEEMKALRDEIKQTLISKQELLLQEERLGINQVAQILNVTRQTVSSYWKQRILPEPKRDLSGRPYWTPEELEPVLKQKGIKTKYVV